MSFQKCLTLAFQRNFTTSTRRPTLVTCEDVGGIRMIGINRPEKKNSVNADTADELFSQFERFDADASVNVAVLFGNGGTFCAGYDLEEISRTDKTLLDRFKRRSPMGPCGMLTNKPIVAAIQGYAVAGGFELALWCDLRVVEETAVMGVFCRRFGMPLLNGGTVRLPQLIGLSRTMDLILTGRAVDGKEAYQIGLANRLVGCGTGVGQALQLATQIKKFPQECLRTDRRSAYYATFQAASQLEAMEYERANAVDIISQEGVEGAKRFVSGIGRHGSFNLTKIQEK
ncbi:uncharacterized protein LOC111260358 isoform X1 [Varroa jacobsoni]|uniref:uncharacterized protein LOC111260358 isoform X1 n=2 Tax=Varroa jacobsoni TaxID=62625 RepID=UPI000BF892AA|nr:uncharacterized protein LOC111260358 isoform X1 [Varroa jacobsoni]